MPEPWLPAKSADLEISARISRLQSAFIVVPGVESDEPESVPTPEASMAGAEAGNSGELSENGEEDAGDG